ncbi:MAG: hypothetical protein KA521_08570, partial [Crocinitomicaceae bacterium]|nr:hypothetical protein [Crocinitomicaceae bacterium]
MKYLFSLLVLLFSLNLMAQIPSYVPTNGLVGYWPFNGNANDVSGNGFNGIVSNVSLTTDRNNISNSAYLWPSTNGTNSFIDVGNLHSLIPNSITISAWILADGGTINPRIISSGEVGFSTQSTINANRYYQAAWDRAGAGIWPSTFPVSSNVWHHLVFTANHINGQAKLYVDGVLTDSSCCGIPNPNYVMNNTWNIGRKSTSAFDAWGGKLDDIGVWNRALTQQEITNLFSSSTPPPTCNITTSDSTLCLGESTTLSIAVSNLSSSFVNWNTGEPNNSMPTTEQYGMIYDNGSWNDHTINFQTSLIIEFNYIINQLNGFTYFGSFNGHSYFKSNNQYTWVNANNLANSLGGYLTVINDQAENDFILLNGNISVNAAWIGLYQDVNDPLYSEPSGGWKWVNQQSIISWSTGATTPSITVSPTATTTYTCTTTVNGVSCTDAITVTVDSLNFSLPATTTVCGTSATLSAPGGATSYLWNTNATTASIAPTTSGLYSCTVTKGACVKSATTQLNLLNPIVSTADSILCVGESSTLTSNTTVSPSSVCSSAALPTNLQTGLVGYWPFCGNANDASGNGNNGTVNGATLTTDRFGNANSAYSFDGNDWISATRAHQAVFTASVWIQSTNGNCNKPILDANNSSWELYSDCANGQLNFIMWNGGTFTYHSTNVALGLNTWYHVVAVYSSSQVKVYVNGSLITTQVTTAVPAISGVLNMGASLSGTTQYFTGKLDDVGLWSRALTLAEIQQLYTQGQTTYSWSPGNATTQSITVSPTSTTTYTCTTTVNGASCSDTIVVTVNPLPTVNAGADQSVCLNQPVTLSGSGAVTYSWNNSVVNNTPFTPTATATYTVTGTDANGCVNTDNVVVTIKPLPTVNAGSDQSVCIGNPAIFNATGAFSYSWSNGVANQVPFFPTTTASYIVTGTGVNGCVNKDTMMITINSLPIVSAGADTSICFGQTVTLSGSGAVSYTWNNGIFNNTPFTPSATANYIVTGTNANACQGSDTVVVTVLALPSINAGLDKTICLGDSVALTASGSPLIAWNNGILNGVYFNPTATTTYTVTGTGANGCTNTDQAIVYVNALPTVFAGADTALCNGTYITLSGSGPVSYTWSNSVSNAVPFIPSSTTTYTVT